VRVDKRTQGDILSRLVARDSRFAVNGWLLAFGSGLLALGWIQ
jgi:hypothetical protein